uniref:Proteinase inhibitor type-2 CEVI57-like n=1 Tax=Nicotiana tabacum TaxID=4097 RepID=A0A1S3X5H6_TOBAC|nr:PREDICTED: proteinase inhibitor type-2 CEVI57-like [Nicotiana tabacum]
MASSKFGVFTLLFLCVFLLGRNYVESKETKYCTQDCLPNVWYMTCPSSGNKKLYPLCINCCRTPKGCKLFGPNDYLILYWPNVIDHFENYQMGYYFTSIISWL